jgi:hypothetical protein
VTTDDTGTDLRSVARTWEELEGVEARFEPESPIFLPMVEETPELWPEESHPLWHPSGRLRPRRADEVAAPERLQQGGKRTPNPMVPSLPKVG